MTFAEAGDSFVIHFWGRTSRGKTTVGQIAASPWGCGADPNDAPERTFIRHWNLTGNGLEGLAEAHSDLPLVLDELGSSTIGDIRPLIYQLAGGQGKPALNSAREMKEPRSWRTIAISTGELSLHAKMSDPDGDGTKSRSVKGGLTHRALDIEIADIAGASPASEREGIVSNLKIACARQYGTAGPELVRCLAARFETAAQVRAWVREQIAVVMGDLAPPGLPAETARSVRRFALIAVAGEFAVRTGLIPATAAQVRACVNMAVTAWLNTSAETDEERIIPMACARLSGCPRPPSHWRLPTSRSPGPLCTLGARTIRSRSRNGWTVWRRIRRGSGRCARKPWRWAWPVGMHSVCGRAEFPPKSRGNSVGPDLAVPTRRRRSWPGRQSDRWSARSGVRFSSRMASL